MEKQKEEARKKKARAEVRVSSAAVLWRLPSSPHPHVVVCGGAQALAAERRRQEYEARIYAEEQARAATEGKVQSLERIEMELIAKLKETQMQQQRAYEELEKALGSTGGSDS